MKIKILESAKDDLKEGFHFYEFQERDIGATNVRRDTFRYFGHIAIPQSSKI